MRDSIVFYRSFYEAVKELPPEEQAVVYNAICSYALDGVEPELSGVAKAVFLLVKPQIDANNARYENSVKGGAPKGNTNAKKVEEKQPKNNQKTTKKQPKDNQKTTKGQPNENVNENVNVNDNENDLKTPEDYLKVFPENLQAKLAEWLRYKNQRKEKYSPIGLRNFFTQVWNRRKEASDMEIVDLIGYCMANNWKGIIWDKLADGKKRGNVKVINNAFVNNQATEYENLERFYNT